MKRDEVCYWQIQYEWGEMADKVPAMLGKFGIHRFEGTIDDVMQACAEIWHKTHSDKMNVFRSTDGINYQSISANVNF